MKEVDLSQYKFYKFLTGLTVLIFFLCTPLTAQHELKIRASKDQPIELDFQNASCMALGCFRPNYLLFNKIANREDGQLSFEITSLESDEEKLTIRLLGSDAFLVWFSYSLEEGELYISERNIVSESNNSETIKIPIMINGDIYTYKESDEFIIYRCQNKVIYLLNGKIVRVANLLHNNFELNGEIKINSSSSVELYANVKFD